MEKLIQEFLQILTPEGFILLVNICITNIVLSGDNAIIIGMATKNLPQENRKKAIAFGIFAATIMRIVFSFFAVWLLEIFGIKLIGGFLLLYVVWKFYKEIRVQAHHDSTGASKHQTTIMSAITTIVIADASMSLDNVLAVAGAAHGNIALLSIGLFISIILMAFAANFIANYLDKYPQIQWLGLFVILFIALEMVYEGAIQVDIEAIHFNILPFITLLVGCIFIFLQQKYIKPLEEKKIQKWMSENYLFINIAFLFILMITFIFGDVVKNFMFSHHIILYTVLFGFLFVILELFGIAKHSSTQKPLAEKIKDLF